METRLLVEGSFGNKFSSIYNHCGGITAWSRKTLPKNNPVRANFQNSVPKGFIATPIDALCSNFVKFGRRKIGKIVRCLPDKNKISPVSPALATARIAPKICQGQPRICTQSTPDFCFSLNYLFLFAFDVLVLVFSLLHQEIGLEERLQNDLFCVELGIKPSLKLNCRPLYSFR